MTTKIISSIIGVAMIAAFFLFNYQAPDCGDQNCLSLTKVNDSTYKKDFLVKNNKSSNPKSIMGWCKVNNVKATYTTPNGSQNPVNAEVSSDTHNWDKEINTLLAATESPVEFTVRTIIDDIPSSDIGKNVELSYSADVTFPVSSDDNTFIEATQSLQWDMKYVFSATSPRQWYHKLRWGYMVVGVIALLTFASSFMPDDEDDELTQGTT